MVQRTSNLFSALYLNMKTTSTSSARSITISRQCQSQRIKTVMVAVYTTTACLCLCVLFSCAAAFSPSTTFISRTDILLLQNSAQSRVPRHNISMQLYAKKKAAPIIYPRFPKDDFDKDDLLDRDDFDSENFDPAIASQIIKAKQLINDAKKKQKDQEEAAAKAAAAAESAGDDDMDDDTAEIETPKKQDKAKLPFFASSASRKIKSTTESGEIIADGETMASLSKSESWEKRSLSQMFDREARQDFDGNTVEVPQTDGKTLADRDIAASMYNLRKSLQLQDFKRVFKGFIVGDVD